MADSEVVFLSVDPVALLTLETTGIILAALCALFGKSSRSSSRNRGLDRFLTGIYFVLFILSLWSTYRHNNASSKKLRIVTIVL